MDLSFKHGFSLSEALDILLNEDTEGDIFIEPPNPHVDTDVDSADEDGSGLVDNLSSRQLLANAEIQFHNNERLGVSYEDLDSQHNTSQVHNFRETSSIVGPNQLPAKYKKWMSSRIKSKSKPCWIKGADFDIEKTTILYLSGYNDLPSKRHYWDNDDDMKNIAVSQSMRRDRFLQICRFFHCTNNTEINQDDKGWKIRPFIEMMKKRCVNNFVPEQHLAYDESMVKYFGRHSCKQFIRGKPIRFVYKIWCLNSKDGYLVNFDLYQGKNLKSNSDYEKLFGKAASPLLVLLDEIPDDKRELNYNIYMDNLFSSPALFSFLRFRGYSAIGTIRDNRIPKNCPLTNKTVF
ncbi:hypothetical protein ACI65C_001808 [Semiaphis heraclei]